MTEQNYYDNKFQLEKEEIEVKMKERRYKIYSMSPLLTMTEAIEYFNIGESKMREIILNVDNNNLIFKNGSRNLVKRELMEKYLLNS